MFIFIFKEMMTMINNNPENIKPYDETLENIFDAEITKNNPNIEFLEFLSDCQNNDVQKEETIDYLTKEIMREFTEYDYHEIRDKFLPRYSLEMTP